MLREIPPTELPRQEKLSEAEEKTFDLLVLEHKKSAINMDEFKRTPRYDERLERDKKSVEKKKTAILKWGTEPTKRAQILEAMFAQQIELSDWLGQNIHTIVPAEYDDLFNGIDLALEIEGESTEYLALGIDATSSPVKIREKLKTIKEHVASGVLATIEYFHSENRPDSYRALERIPQVVIGADRKTIRELSELWIIAYGLPKLRQKAGGPPLSPGAEQSHRKMIKEAKEKLGRHRVQFLLLEQIKIQLTVFRDFSIRQNQTEAAQKFSSFLELIEAVLKEKEAPDKEGVFENSEDTVFQALTDAINDFDSL